CSRKTLDGCSGPPPCSVVSPLWTLWSRSRGPPRRQVPDHSGVVRPFVRLLAETLPLYAAPAGVTLLTEIRGNLPGLLRRRVSRKPLSASDLNMGLVAPMWRRAVLD